MVILSMAFAILLIELDSAGFTHWLSRWPRIFGAEADGASNDPQQRLWRY
jgi:hypothetical protein